MRRLILATLLGSALLPGLALAQNPPAPPPAGMPAPPPGGPCGMGGPGGWHHGHGGWDKHHGFGPAEMLNAFYAANTTHDGHLTLAQAKAAKLKPIVEHFSAIDVNNRGYVTFYDIEAWHLDQVAQHLEQKATQLRAKDNG